jgi:hypothetical protein
MAVAQGNISTETSLSVVCCALVPELSTTCSNLPPFKDQSLTLRGPYPYSLGAYSLYDLSSYCSFSYCSFDSYLLSYLGSYSLSFSYLGAYLSASSYCSHSQGGWWVFWQGGGAGKEGRVALKCGRSVGKLFVSC